MERLGMTNSWKDAFYFLLNMPKELPNPSTVVEAEDGEVVLDWVNQDYRVIVSIIGDSWMGYALFVNNKFMAGAADHKIGDKFPDDLYKYLVVNFSCPKNKSCHYSLNKSVCDHRPMNIKHGTAYCEKCGHTENIVDINKFATRLQFLRDKNT